MDDDTTAPSPPSPIRRRRTFVHHADPVPLFDLFLHFDSLPHADIAKWLARHNPDLFSTACQELRINPGMADRPEWFEGLLVEAYSVRTPAMPRTYLGENDTVVENPYYNLNPVAAIKYLRTNTGLGLKEAKDAIDTFRGIPDPLGSRGLAGTTMGTKLIEWNMGAYL